MDFNSGLPVSRLAVVLAHLPLRGLFKGTRSFGIVAKNQRWKTSFPMLGQLIRRRRSAFLSITGTWCNKKITKHTQHDRETTAMKNFTTQIKRFLISEDGPTAVEYAVMLALIIVVCLTAVGAVGTNANLKFTAVKNAL
jgi:pilus assembly protein Flp/PilA